MNPYFPLLPPGLGVLEVRDCVLPTPASSVLSSVPGAQHRSSGYVWNTCEPRWMPLLVEGRSVEQLQVLLRSQTRQRNLGAKGSSFQIQELPFSPPRGIGERVCTRAGKSQTPRSPGITQLLNSCWERGVKSGKRIRSAVREGCWVDQHHASRTGWSVTPGAVQETPGPSVAFLLFVSPTPCWLPEHSNSLV